eukprot:m.180359 g.180359  ORF g.180359 m.180359 type:complete len:491 (-) comp14984_c0_seq1:136-1608(-)
MPTGLRGPLIMRASAASAVAGPRAGTQSGEAGTSSPASARAMHTSPSPPNGVARPGKAAATGVSATVRDGLEQFPIAWAAAASALHAAVYMLYYPLRVCAHMIAYVGHQRNAASAPAAIGSSDGAKVGGVVNGKVGGSGGELRHRLNATVTTSGDTHENGGIRVDNVETTQRAPDGRVSPSLDAPDEGLVFERRNIRVMDTAETDTVSVGDRDNADLTIVVIPGNPGHALFYTGYIGALYKCAVASGMSNVCVLGISHLGHSPAAPAPPCSYAEQSDHTAQVVATLQRKNPKSKFVIVGHSIGSRLLLDMFSGNGAKAGWVPSRVARAVLLFPTVSYIGYSPNGYLNYPVLRLHAGMGALLEALRPALRPEWLAPVVRVRLGPLAHEDGVQALGEIIGSDSAGNLLYMGLTEMMHVLEPPRVDPDLQRKVLFYIGGQCEKWVTRPDVEELADVFTEATLLHCQQEIPHAFVLTHNEDVAGKTWSWIEEAL